MQAIQQFRTFNRPVQLLLLNQLAIMIGFSMLMPYLTGYLTTTLGFAAWVAGLVLGLRTFSQQGLCVIGGTLADHVGYKPVIAGGCVLRMAGFLLFAFSDALPSVLLAALLSGLGGALFAPAVRAYLASESGERRVEAFALSLIPTLGRNRLLGTYFGFYYLVQGSGTIVGNLAIGAAFDSGVALGFRSLPWLLLLAFGLASALSITALDRKGTKAHSSDVSRLANMTEARS